MSVKAAIDRLLDEHGKDYDWLIAQLEPHDDLGAVGKEARDELQKLQQGDDTFVVQNDVILLVGFSLQLGVQDFNSLYESAPQRGVFQLASLLQKSNADTVSEDEVALELRKALQSMMERLRGRKFSQRNIQSDFGMLDQVLLTHNRDAFASEMHVPESMCSALYDGMTWHPDERQRRRESPDHFGQMMSIRIFDKYPTTVPFSRIFKGHICDGKRVSVNDVHDMLRGIPHPALLEKLDEVCEVLAFDEAEKSQFIGALAAVLDERYAVASDRLGQFRARHGLKDPSEIVAISSEPFVLQSIREESSLEDEHIMNRVNGRLKHTGDMPIEEADVKKLVDGAKKASPAVWNALASVLEANNSEKTTLNSQLAERELVTLAARGKTG